LYARTGPANGERLIDGLTRNGICDAYRDRVVLVARRIAERLPSDCNLEMEDLVSLGAMGLLEAFDRFDPDRNILFSTFAEYRIRGAMMDGLRQGDSFTRYRRQLARRIQYGLNELTQALGRAPEHSEVAEHLEMTLEAYYHALDTTQPVSHQSFEEPDNGAEEGRPLVEVLIGSYGDEGYRAILGTQTRRLLREAIRELPERKRQCILLYYGRGLNLSEIARVFDVTPSRISQILTAARKDLRETLEGLIDPYDANMYDHKSEAEAL
jgi:RNA polymerase sigma factor FliA